MAHDAEVIIMDDGYRYAVDEHGRLEVPMRKVHADELAAEAPTAEECDRLERLAYDAGAADGRAAASWYFDGNTPRATYQWALDGIRDGDPAVYDTFPSSPLSGEWADSLTPGDVLEAVGISWEHDAADSVLDFYVDGFEVAAVHEIERLAIAALEPEENGDTDV